MEEKEDGCDVNGGAGLTLILPMSSCVYVCMKLQLMLDLCKLLAQQTVLLLFLFDMTAFHCLAICWQGKTIFKDNMSLLLMAFEE